MLTPDVSFQNRPLSACEIDAVKRQLRRWVVRQCWISGLVIYFATFALTQPSFGMGGPNYLTATFVALAGAALVGLFTAVRAYLHVQKLLATQAGLTLQYRLGQLLRGNFKRRTDE